MEGGQYLALLSITDTPSTIDNRHKANCMTKILQTNCILTRFFQFIR